MQKSIEYQQGNYCRSYDESFSSIVQSAETSQRYTPMQCEKREKQKKKEKQTVAALHAWKL